MVNVWPTMTVEQLQQRRILLVEDGNHGEYRPRPDEFVSAGVAFIRAADMDSGRVLFESASKINAHARQRITKGIGAPGDVLLSHKGTVGKLALVPDDAPAFVCSPQTTFWRTLDQERLDRKFLYAFLRSPGFHAQLATRAGETDMAPYVSLTSQRGLHVTLPPITTQRTIGNILGTLDDKIELNRRMNETLEALARALFKWWFVDFDPGRAKAEGRDPGLPKPLADLFPDRFVDSELGEIPQGWQLGPILICAELLNGGTPKTDRAEFWGGPVSWASAKDVSQCGQTFLLDTERTITAKGLEESATQLIPAFSTVVVARGATTGRIVLFGREMAMNQTCYALKSKLNAPFALYCQLRQEINALVHAAHGSVFDTITTSTFTNSKVVIPTPELIAAFERLAAPVFLRILSNTDESRTLATLRDILLPKLISGELRIYDAEKLAAWVL